MPDRSTHEPVVAATDRAASPDRTEWTAHEQQLHPAAHAGLSAPSAQTTTATSATPATPETRHPPIEHRAWRGRGLTFLRRAGLLALLIIALAAALAWAIAQPWWPQQLLSRVPEPARIVQWLRSPDLATLPGLPTAWNPWAPLTLEEPETPLTRWKITLLERNPAACQAWLATAPGSDLTPLPDRTDTGTLLCGWRAASRIRRLDGIGFSSPFTLACGAAVSLARWERHALQPAAREYLGSEVTRIDHLGSYACRTIGSGSGGRLSTHASANALDIAGFGLADGRRISVRRDWRSEKEVNSHAQARPLSRPQTDVGDASDRAAAQPAAQQNARQASSPLAEARFLRAARDGACRSFNAVLGPEYNAAHRDHFHLDRGPNRVCR